MDYKINLPVFEGPLDLLLHLIRKDNINIFDINIDDITKQYLICINKMQEMNLNIASEYLVMAAELIEMKSSLLLPNYTDEDNDEFESAKEKLINRLVEYEKYKEITKSFGDLEEIRKEVYTKEPNSLLEYKSDNSNINYGVNIDDLIGAFKKFLNEKELDKPLSTKITNKDYSIGKRCIEIRDLLRVKKSISFNELFDNCNKSYIVATFLALLNLCKKQEIEIIQKTNFNNFIIKGNV